MKVSGIGECNLGAFEGELCMTVVMVGVGCLHIG